MSGALTTILLVLSVLIIIAIFMQPTKTNRATSLTQAQMTYLNDQKRAGLKPVMQRLTAVMIFFWLLIAMILMVLSSR